MELGNANGEIMTLTEVADYLQLAERTVLRMAQRGDIPAAKVASQWRFMRSLIREWLVGQMQAFPAQPITPSGDLRDPLLPLREILHPELMTFDIEPGPKESILRQLLAPLLKTGFAKDTNLLLSGLLDRERMMTTAVGHGIAIPHPRRLIPGMFPEPAVALGICPKGADFGAIDDQLVHIFFLTCATREEIHLRLMANLSLLTRRDDIIMGLRNSTTSRQVVELVSPRSE
ncbi:MAG: PTS transporter subunit EIIA [Phycisphaerales bacterium]|jgi:nitrogen PTS system EIIA component|nr:PTS transporter subunit EIIA [Phycisphaerales bacterium]